MALLGGEQLRRPGRPAAGPPRRADARRRRAGGGRRRAAGGRGRRGARRPARRRRGCAGRCGGPGRRAPARPSPGATAWCRRSSAYRCSAAVRYWPTAWTSDCGARRGRLQRGVGHLVGHAAVDLVAEPGEHGHRRGGDRPGDRLGIERGQLVAGAAAADDDDHVEAAPLGVPRQRLDRPGHPARRVGSLDRGVGEDDVEPEAAALRARRGSRARPRCRRWTRRRCATAPGRAAAGR